MTWVRWAALSVSLVSGLAGSARAQCAEPSAIEEGCYAEDADWNWQAQLFDAIDFDSGWVPSGSPLQVRVTFRLAGETELDVGGTPTAQWPTPIELRVPGRPGTGNFRIDYGMETHAYFRFDVEVAGIRYTFEDEIDIPFLPADLRFAAEQVFDPFLLPPSEPVRLADRTERFSLVEVDLAGSIGIPGVGGGFRLDTEGELRAAYQTTTIVVDEAPAIFMDDEYAPLVPGDDGDFGPGMDVAIHPEGVLDYDGAMVFFPTVFLDVVGTGFDFALAEIPVDIVSLSNDVVFDDVIVHVPLPDLVTPGPVDFGEVPVGELAEAIVRIENEGEAPLEVQLEIARGGPFALTDTRLTIPPRSNVATALRFRTMDAGPVMSSLDLRTNDPDSPLVMVPLSATSVVVVPDAGPMFDDAGPMFDAGPDAAHAPGYAGGGCGCETTGGRAPLWALAFVALLARRRRS